MKRDVHGLILEYSDLADEKDYNKLILDMEYNLARLYNFSGEAKELPTHISKAGSYDIKNSRDVSVVDCSERVELRIEKVKDLRLTASTVIIKGINSDCRTNAYLADIDFNRKPLNVLQIYGDCTIRNANIKRLCVEDSANLVLVDSNIDELENDSNAELNIELINSAIKEGYDG